MAKITRRRFIESTAATAAAVGLAGLRVPNVLAAGPRPDIVDVSGSDPKAMVAAAFAALGGIGKIVHKGDYVVLKPNAAFANPPAWGTTTHPDTVVAVAQACLDAGAKRVTIVEFPQAKGMKCLERCGLVDALKAVPDVSLKLLAGLRDFKPVQVEDHVVLEKVDVAKHVLSTDVLINIPAAKAHEATGVSLGLKNAMGLIRDRSAFHNMFDLHQGIADLARVIKPQLTLVDATRVLLTNGPAGPGETATPGRMVAGFNVVSVDAYALQVARFGGRSLKVSDVRHIELAGKAGLGEVDVSKLRVEKVQA